MDIADQYKLIAEEAGLTIGQVGSYLAQVLPQLMAHGSFTSA